MNNIRKYLKNRKYFKKHILNIYFAFLRKI